MSHSNYSKQEGDTTRIIDHCILYSEVLPYYNIGKFLLGIRNNQEISTKWKKKFSVPKPLLLLVYLGLAQSHPE